MDSRQIAARAASEWSIKQGDWFGGREGRRLSCQRRRRRADITVSSGVLRFGFAVERFRVEDDDTETIALIEVTVQDQLDRFARFADALGPVRGWDGCWSHAS